MRQADHPLHATWETMKDRCNRPKSSRWKYYGGRGITVCSAWQSSFWQFVSDMGERPAGTTLDRRDNNGNYEPSNCRWATAHTQKRNTRRNVMITHDGLTMCIGDWRDYLGITQNAMWSRIKMHGHQKAVEMGRGRNRGPKKTELREPISCATV